MPVAVVVTHSDVLDGCGTPVGYRRHVRHRERPCRACCGANADATAVWRLYRDALVGREPAEALPTRHRHRLVAELHSDGLTDHEIAAHTRMTTYTAARIRAEIGLLPNRPSATSTRGVA
jgi:hypothetical protein